MADILNNGITIFPLGTASGVLPVWTTGAEDVIATASTNWIILEIAVCNISAATQGFALSIVPSGETEAPATPSYRVYDTLNSQTFLPGTTWVFEHLTHMGQGDMITAQATAASSVSVRITGASIS